MGDWSFIVADVEGDHLGDLATASAKSVIWPLDAAATASFTMDGTDPKAALVVEAETDLIVIDGTNRRRFRGRMGSSDADVSATGHVSNYSAVDYRGFLDRRFIQDAWPLTYTTTEQVAIAWDLISRSQALAGGGLGITDGTVPTGIFRTRTLTAGNSLQQTITEFGDLASGFDWEIDADLVFRTFYPQRGIDPGLTLAYGAQILSFKETKDTSTFATAIRFSGDSTLTTQFRTVTTFGPAGRWEVQVGDPNIFDQAILNARADSELIQDQAFTPTWECVLDLSKFAWTPDLLWVGDTVTLVLKSGNINVNAPYRVLQVQVDLGDDGGKTVTLTFGTALTTEQKRLRKVVAGIASLNRR